MQPPLCVMSLIAIYPSALIPCPSSPHSAFLLVPYTTHPIPARPHLCPHVRLRLLERPDAQPPLPPDADQVAARVGLGAQDLGAGRGGVGWGWGAGGEGGRRGAKLSVRTPCGPNK